MKPKLRLLPTEVWVDILCFPWITRSELGRLVDQIGNRKFAEFLQFYLHEWGKHTLKYLVFRETGLHHLCFDRPPGSISSPPLEIPQTEMPENIKSFYEIDINHINAQTLGFLRRIQPLLGGVNPILLFNKAEEGANTRAVLAHLSPLLNGINSICFTDHAIPLAAELFTESLQLDKIKVLTINLLNFDWEPAVPLDATINFALNWLTSEQDCTEPKLFVPHIFAEHFEPLCAAIKKNFLSAKSPCTFAVEFTFGVDQHVADFHLENGIGEQLHGQKEVQYSSIDFTHYSFQITRHQANASTHQLREWAEETGKRCYPKRIFIDQHTTIGQIDATGDGEVNGGGDGKAADQPSTSKG